MKLSYTTIQKFGVQIIIIIFFFKKFYTFFIEQGWKQNQ